MALIVEDCVVETSTTTGTGALTLAGAMTGFKAFSSVMTSPSDTCYYLIEAVDGSGIRTGDWEAGLGTYSAANTLTRTTPQRSSNANAAVVFAAGTKRVHLSATRSYLALLANIYATAAEIRTGTEAAKAIAPDQFVAAAAPQTLTDGATINWDMASGYNAKVTLGGNRTMAAPTNRYVGLSYALEVIQDGTGTRTMTWNAAFDWGTAGTPVLSTAASKRDLVFMYCYDASTPKFRATFSKDA